jgi:hypothetical protein
MLHGMSRVRNLMIMAPIVGYGLDSVIKSPTRESEDVDSYASSHSFLSLKNIFKIPISSSHTSSNFENKTMKDSLDGMVKPNQIIAVSPVSSTSSSSSLPIYRSKDVALHDSIERGVWVIYGEGVYDITSFIKNHPGT